MSECNLGKVKLEPMLSVDWFTAAMCGGSILGFLFSERYRIQKNLINPNFIIPRYDTIKHGKHSLRYAQVHSFGQK